MRKHHLVHLGLSLAFLAPILPGGATATAGAGSTSTRAKASEHNGQPTVGGVPAFATRADAMASTVQGLIQAANLDGAERAAIELTSTYASYAEGWLLLGYCRSLTSQFDASNDAYDHAEALGIDEKVVLTRKAYNYIKLGEYDLARQSYRKVLLNDPNDADVLIQLGYLEGKLDNLDEAALNYRRALGLDPKNTAVIASLVKIEEKRGMKGEVRRLLERGLEVDPDNTAFLHRLAAIEIKEKHYQTALTYLDRLIALNPDDAKTLRNRGVAYYSLGDKSKAGDAFERVRELGGDMEGLYGPLAESRYKEGAYGEALTVIKEGIERGDQEAWLYCVWGNVLEDIKDYDGASAKFHHALSLDVAPWSTYARKQIVRQAKLKQRATIISNQQKME
jgi:tetratricopeptide (TPR) repeat protein